jgi:hypothetical protein
MMGSVAERRRPGFGSMRAREESLPAVSEYVPGRLAEEADDLLYYLIARCLPALTIESEGTRRSAACREGDADPAPHSRLNGRLPASRGAREGTSMMRPVLYAEFGRVAASAATTRRCSQHITATWPFRGLLRLHSSRSA